MKYAGQRRCGSISAESGLLGDVRSTPDSRLPLQLAAGPLGAKPRSRHRLRLAGPIRENVVNLGLWRGDDTTAGVS
jgi:hypothetical protein